MKFDNPGNIKVLNSNINTNLDRFIYKGVLMTIRVTSLNIMIIKQFLSGKDMGSIRGIEQNGHLKIGGKKM